MVESSAGASAGWPYEIHEINFRAKIDPRTTEEIDLSEYMHDQDFRETIFGVMNSVATDIAREERLPHLKPYSDLKLEEGSIEATMIFAFQVFANVVDIVGAATTAVVIPVTYRRFEHELAVRLERALQRFRDFMVRAMIVPGRITTVTPPSSVETSQKSSDYNRFLPLARILAMSIAALILGVAIWRVVKQNDTRTAEEEIKRVTEMLQKIEENISSLRRDVKTLRSAPCKIETTNLAICVPDECNDPPCARGRQP